jgi:UDP-glucose 4-epimerase
MRAVVTGGAGFIGSHMVDLLLDRGFEVRVIDNMITGRRENLEHHSKNPKCLLEEGDICDLKDNSSLFKDVDFIFHFAGIGDIVPSIERPRDYLRANVQGTVAVLEAARHSGKVRKVVYAASSSCYGMCVEIPTSETAPIRVEHPYALSKYLGECAVLHWHQVYKLPVNSIRIFNAYGPRSRTSGAYGAVFGVFLAQKLKGQPFTVVGDGTQKRDFVYVTDLVQAFYAAAETDISGEIFNVGAGNPQMVNRLVELLEGPVVYVPKRPGEPDCTWANIGKINNRLGWSPQVSFEKGVASLMKQISYWSQAPVWTPKTIESVTKKWFEYLG